MQKLFNSGTLLCLFICFLSCKKNNNNNTPTYALDGTWSFTSVQIMNSVFTTNGVDTTISSSNYITSENGGTMIISGGTISCSNIGFTANVPTLIVSYQNNQPNDTIENSLTTKTISSLNSTSEFQITGTDSIHFTSTGFPDSVSNTIPIATGAKYIISGNTLKLTSEIFVNKMSGPTIQNETDTVITTLNKQ